MFFKALAAIFTPSRPLNPSQQSNFSQPKSSQSLSLETKGNFKIFLNIVRASGIPTRLKTVTDNDSRQRSSGSSNMFITQSNFLLNI